MGRDALSAGVPLDVEGEGGFWWETKRAAVSQGGQWSVLGVTPTEDFEGRLTGYICHEFRGG